jgi:hypothetical protein
MVAHAYLAGANGDLDLVPCSWPFGSTSASKCPCALEYAPVPPTITPEKLGGAVRPRGGRHSASERSAVGELLAAASHDGA